MRSVRYLVAVSGVCIFGCGTKIAQTTYEPAAGGGRDGTVSPIPPPACGATLKERLSVTSINVDANVRYKRAGYGNFPSDERIAMDVQPNGASQVAWLDDDLAKVHVTPLNMDQQRAGSDVTVDGFDLGGLVAHDDGFAVLTRRPDPGEPIGDGADGGAGVAPAAFLVRVRGTQEIFAAPLTGTRNITDDADTLRRDCSPGLSGRLAFNGAYYGAYFVVRGCRGDWAEGRYGDKLVYADTRGNFLRGGWSWRCSRNLGLRLVPEPSPSIFTAVCMTDAQPQPGINLVVGDSTLLAHEVVAPGYIGSEFGSIIKLADGRYFVGWATRGVQVPLTDPAVPGMDTQDIGYVVLGRDFTPSRSPWLVQTADIHETNVHFAPYGANRILAIWDAIASPQCKNGVCFGQFVGTHFRLLNLDGSPASAEEIIPAATPTTDDDIVVFPNGDLGWAFVTQTRDYSAPLDTTSGAPSVPALRQIHVARFMYCD